MAILSGSIPLHEFIMRRDLGRVSKNKIHAQTYNKL